MRRGIAHLRLHNPPPGIWKLPENARYLGYRVIDVREPILAEARGVWPFKYLAVGPTWFLLDMQAQTAALLHEVGHCKGFHLEIRLLLLPFCRTQWVKRLCVRQELAADRFAVNAGYGFDLALLLRRYGSTADVGDYHPAYAERMAALEDAA